MTQLPKLEGSEKQVKWAEEIRSKRLEEVDKKIAREKEMLATYQEKGKSQAILDDIQKGIRELELGKKALATKTIASGWIGRFNSIDGPTAALSALDLIRKQSPKITHDELDTMFTNLLNKKLGGATYGEGGQ